MTVTMHTPKLHLTKKGSLLRFRWFAGPRQAPMEFRRELGERGDAELQKMMGFAHDAAAGKKSTDQPSLLEIGKTLYRLLIPEELRALLKQNQQPLAICGGDPLFPWEILHDGDEFFGLSAPIGRLPSWFESSSMVTEVVKGITPDELHVVMLSDLLGDLQDARREIDALSDQLPLRQSRSLIGAEAADLPHLQEALKAHHKPSQPTLLHVAARASFEPVGGPQIPLRNEPLTPKSLRLAFSGPLWAFFHFHPDETHPPNAPATVVSFASSLLDEGVQGVVIGLRPNFTIGGRQMISDYYRFLFERIPPAEALMKARRRFLQRNPQDASWSSFVFFGDPGVLLLQQPDSRNKTAVPLRSLEPAGAAAGTGSSSGASGSEPSLTGGSGASPGDSSLSVEGGTLEYDFDLEQAIGIALMEAKNLRQDFIGTPHLFIGLTKCPGGVTRALLETAGFDPKKVRDTIRYALGFGHASLDAKILPTQRCARALKAAESNARKENDHLVREKHLLAAILQSGEGLAFEVLKKMGADPQKLYDKLLRGEIPQARVRPGGETPTIDRYGRDLTLLAEQGALPPLTGRSEELMRLAQILLRRFKNNPLIIGEAGVGKTALVEGLAQRIVAQAVPEDLRGRRLVELSLSSLVAGTRYRGDFEERLTMVIREAREHPEVILFLDEFHTVVGAGETHQGTLDAANILKPALARGELRCIGATTPVEYRKYIEKDAALERRFHPLFLEEPSMDETMDILFGARHGYEEHHKVEISDEVMRSAVELAVRYLPDRRLPDKALDLIDEACALVTLRGYAASMLTSEGKLRSPEQRPLVTEASVFKVLADWTGIPVGEISREESLRLLELQNRLGKRVLGQEPAVQVVSQAVQMGRAGLKRTSRPTAVMLFLGPSGVGKTELCRSLARELFGQESAMIRLDMSEYAEKHSTSRLIGAPPGYVGYGEERQILAQLHHRPYSVVLMDEIEKAHPEVLDLFLQLFEEGRLTDSLGRTVDGRHAVFIMTSNLLAERFQKQRKAVGFQVADEEIVPKAEIDVELRRFFRPEFLNRVDETILFQPLIEEDLLKIARLHFDELAERAAAQDVHLRGDDDALAALVKKSMDPSLGARPLLRAIERYVARPLSRMLLQAMSEPEASPIKAHLILQEDQELPTLLLEGSAQSPPLSLTASQLLASED
ncbi:MAG: AAA family ATPase [Myxococcales bacterium]|nr:AAA family ATPase [Myxococcales bacterium]